MSTTASKLRHTLAVKANSEIKKSKHDRSKRPFGEVLLAAEWRSVAMPVGGMRLGLRAVLDPDQLTGSL